MDMSLKELLNDELITQEGPAICQNKAIVCQKESSESGKR